MADEVVTASFEELDQFCIEELILRAAGIRHALGRFSHTTETVPSANAASVKTSLPEVLDEIRTLREKCDELSGMLGNVVQQGAVQPANRPPLMLVNPLGEPRRYALEKVLDKWSEARG